MRNEFAILVLMAHPDDAELWAGGTIAKYEEASENVMICVGGNDIDRAQEARRGAKVLGSNIFCFFRASLKTS